MSKCMSFVCGVILKVLKKIFCEKVLKNNCEKVCGN
jgi:hypothetical protein